MRFKQSTLLFVIALSLFAIVLTGCGSQATSTLPVDTGQASPPTSSQSDRAAAPVLLSNPLPGQLDAYINVTMGGYDLTSRATTTVGFSFSYNGRIVQFTGQERLTCNGKDVSIHGKDATFQVAEAPTSTLEGRTYSCTYIVKGTSATLKFIVPTAPVISSPQDFAKVTRSSSTSITYETHGGTLMGIVALTAREKAVAHLNAPGRMQATVDTSTFPAGPGSLSLTQTLDLKISQAGTLFHAIGSGGTGMTMVTVTWV